jgi:hypothetical protein
VSDHIFTLSEENSAAPPTLFQLCGFLAVGILLLARRSDGVPASPSDKLWEELGNVKAMMAAVSGK